MRLKFANNFFPVFFILFWLPLLYVDTDMYIERKNAMYRYINIFIHYFSRYFYSFFFFSLNLCVFFFMRTEYQIVRSLSSWVDVLSSGSRQNNSVDCSRRSNLNCRVGFTDFKKYIQNTWQNKTNMNNIQPAKTSSIVMVVFSFYFVNRLLPFLYLHRK